MADAPAGRKNTFLFSRTLILACFSIYGIVWSIQNTIQKCDTIDHNNVIFSNYILQRSKINHVSFLLTRTDLNQLSPTRTIKRSSVMNTNFTNNNHSWLAAILLLSGDLHLNPGPTGTFTTSTNNLNKCPKFPCGVCRKACKWRQKAVACDNCDTWYHKECMFLNSKIYDALTISPNLTWCCWTCGIPNFSSSLFENDFSSLSSVNRFEILTNNESSFINSSYETPIKPFSSNFKPQKSSTPDPKNKDKMHHPDSPSCSSTLKCLVINCQSLFGKRAELNNLIESNKVDVLIGTETWLKPDINNSELLLDDFDIYRRDRTEKGGGGILLAVRKCFTSEYIHKGKNSETIFCKINIKGRKPILIGAIYRPPDKNLELCEAITEDIFQITKKYKGAMFWLGGDFNLPDINWKQEIIKSNQYPKPINLKFLDMAGDLGLKQIVHTPTRENSCLDLFYTNNPSLINNTSVVSGISDHDAVLVETKLKPFRKKPIKRKIQLWKRIDEGRLKKDCKNFKLAFLNKHTIKDNINELWQDIKNNLINIMEDNVPTKMTSSKTHQPWINTVTKRLIRKKQRWFP